MQYIIHVHFVLSQGLFGRRKRSTDNMPMVDTEETRARLLEYIKTLDPETRECLTECKPCAPFIGSKPIIMAEGQYPYFSFDQFFTSDPL